MIGPAVTAFTTGSIQKTLGKALGRGDTLENSAGKPELSEKELRKSVDSLLKSNSFQSADPIKKTQENLKERTTILENLNLDKQRKVIEQSKSLLGSA